MECDKSGPGKVLSQGQSSSAPQQVECHGKKVSTVRESDVLEVIYRDSNNEQPPVDSDQVQCTQSMWQKSVQSTPLIGQPTGINVNERRTNSASCDYPTPAIWRSSWPTLQLWRLPKTLDRLEKASEETSQALPVRTRVSAIGSKNPPAPERRHTQQSNLCFFCEQNREHEKEGWKIHLCPSSTGMWADCMEEQPRQEILQGQMPL